MPYSLLGNFLFAVKNDRGNDSRENRTAVYDILKSIVAAAAVKPVPRTGLIICENDDPAIPQDSIQDPGSQGK